MVISRCTWMLLLTAAAAVAAAAPVASDCPPPNPAQEGATGSVTISTPGMPLDQLLAEVSRQSGERHGLAAGYEDRAVMAHLKDLPAERVRNAVSALFGDVWIRSGEGVAARYLLHPSFQRRAEQQRIVAAHRQFLRDQVERQVAAARANPDRGFRRLNDSRSHEVTDVDISITNLFLALTAEDRAGLIRGGALRVTQATATGPMREPFRRLLEEHMAPRAVPRLPGWREQAWVEFRGFPMQLSGGGIQQIPFMGVVASARPYVGSAPRYALSVDGAAVAEQLREIFRRVAPARQTPESELTAEQARSLDLVVPDQPGLYTPIASGRGWVLERLARAMQLDVIADVHTRYIIGFRGAGPRLNGLTLRKALTQLAENDSARWWVKDGVYLLRSELWAVEDPAEPPATKRAAWLRVLRETDVLTLEQTAEIAALPHYQQERMTWNFSELQVTGNPWMRFYAGLTPEQRIRSQSEEGLPMVEVDPRHRTLLTVDDPDNPLARNDAIVESIQTGRAVLTVSLYKRDVDFNPVRPNRRTRVRFRIAPLPSDETEEGVKPADVSLGLPDYIRRNTDD